MRRLLLFLILLLWSGAALAWEPSADVRASLAKGRAHIEVRPDPDGASGLIAAAVEIAAPPSVVWAILIDCDLAPRMAPNLKSCTITGRDLAGRWDVREQIAQPGLLPPFRTLVRSDFEAPRRLRFHRTGGDLTVLEGEWRLVPLEGGRRTLVIYQSRASSPYPVPASLARLVLRRDVAAALSALARESVARAGGRIVP